MFLNTEVIHSEPQRHISGNGPRQTPHPPLFISLNGGGEPAWGVATVPYSILHRQPLPGQVSSAVGEDLSVNENLSRKTPPLPLMAIVISHFILSSLRQITLFIPTQQKQKPGECNWVWQVHRMQVRMRLWGETLPVAYPFVVMWYSVTYLEWLIMPICFPYATLQRAIYKSFYQHKLYPPLNSTKC